VQSGDIIRPSAAPCEAKPESDETARSAVYGAALHDNRAEHQPIRRSTIVKPGDRDSLQTVLAPGTRALTIPVAGAAGGTGTMFPGDHVDVMLTQTFKNEDAPLTRRSVSETVVDNLRVPAIDTGTKPGAGAGANTISFRNSPRRSMSRKSSASCPWPCVASVSPESQRPR
jgi:Flp pilus assembly protein CpaB